MSLRLVPTLASRRSARRAADESGVIAIVVALCAVLVFGVSALVVDLGNARDVRRQAQSSADAAALAGGNRLYLTSPTAAVNEAADEIKAYAAKNYGITNSQWTSCMDPNRPVGFVASAASQCISFNNLGVNPTEVRVVMPTRSVNTPMASVLGVREVRVAASAQARLEIVSGSPCGLCVVGDGNHALNNGNVRVTGSNAHFNGSVVNLGPQGSVQVAGGNTTVQGSVTGAAGFTPAAMTGQPAIDDPLAYVTLPPVMTGLTFTAGVSPCVKGPGLYGSQDLRNQNCVLAPGLYVIAGATSLWDLAGTASTKLTGTGVTLYFTCGTPSVPVACSPGQDGATIDASGLGNIAITGPVAGPLKGLSIVYDRNNDETLRLTGNGAAGFIGSIYMRSARLLVNGNGCGDALRSLIIVDRIEFNGTQACLSSVYDQASNAYVPPNGLRLSK